jgi:hypothetical protein
MKPELVVFFGAFGICAALAAMGAGCSDPCECPSTPEQPDEATLRVLQASYFDDQGSEGSLAVHPQGGTVAITGRTVVIRYTESGVDHEVVYSVSGPL